MKKQLALVALIFGISVAYVHAQQRPVSLTFSGTSEVSTVNLQPGANTEKEVFAGNGTLGPFTYRELQAFTAPQPSSTCSGPTHLYFPIVSGAGVFRLQEGSLLMVTSTEGAICVDLTVPDGQVNVNYQITGGTGIFKGASGALTLTADSLPILFTSAGEPVLFAATGKFTGTVSVPAQ